MSWKRIAIGMVIAVALSTRALGSGDPTPRPVYVFADPQDDGERAAMATGRLGILKGATSDALLYLSWRRLNGLAVDQTAANALAAPCCGAQATRQNAWLEARRLIPGVEQVYWIAPERDGPNFVSVPTCFDDAFATAAATLTDRLKRFGAASPAVRAWVAAQDAVFTACSKPVAALPALPGDAPAWLKADRAYQEAALALYNGQSVVAAQRFAAIARDAASPWQPLGLYLSARAIEHAAIASPSPAGYAAAHAALDRLQAAPAGTYGRAELGRMLQVLAFHEHPDQLLASLDRALNASRPMPDIAVAFRDYTLLSDSRPDKPDAVDWIRTIQAKDRAVGLAHATARWRASGTSAWLAAALTLADPADGAAPALAQAAARITPADPAWLTARYHRMRLTMPHADPATIRAQADAILSRSDLIRSDRNVIEAVRTQAASSLADFAVHALRDPYCVAGSAICTESLPPGGDGLVGRLPSGRFAGLGPDARAIIDRLPLARRVTLVDMPGLPAEIRLDIALTSYVRAVQLRNDAIVDRLARRLVTLLPQTRADWRRIAQTPRGPDKLFAETFVMTKIPSLRVDLASYSRPTGTVRQFAGYWVDLILPMGAARLPPRRFAPAIAYLPDGYWEGSPVDPAQERADLACLDKCGGAPFALHSPPFATTLLPAALLERRSFLVTETTWDASGHPLVSGAPGLSLWDTAYQYVARHPLDARSAETLYRLIRVARWGGNHDHLGRRAFKLLHQRYPGSVWTRRSPFYYD